MELHNEHKPTITTTRPNSWNVNKEVFHWFTHSLIGPISHNHIHPEGGASSADGPELEDEEEDIWGMSTQVSIVLVMWVIWLYLARLHCGWEVGTVSRRKQLRKETLVRIRKNKVGPIYELHHHDRLKQQEEQDLMQWDNFSITFPNVMKPMRLQPLKTNPHIL